MYMYIYLYTNCIALSAYSNFSTLKLVTTTEQNYDIENLTKRSYDLTPFKTDLNLDADVFFKKI